MPYTKPENREQTRKTSVPITGGDLTFMLCDLILNGVYPQTEWEGIFYGIFERWIQRTGASYNGAFVIIGGAVVNTGLEFERRGWYQEHEFGLNQMIAAYRRFYKEVIGPYEDTKIKENGDIR